MSACHWEKAAWLTQWMLDMIYAAVPLLDPLDVILQHIQLIISGEVPRETFLLLIGLEEMHLVGLMVGLEKFVVGVVHGPSQ